jgi:prepilin-type N-terminal cleavage/methylation domain-containing protein
MGQAGAASSARRPCAFTLLELLIVVVVVGILSSMGLVSYRKAIERGYWREAQDLLLTIYYGEREYFFTNDTYRTVSDTDGMSAWRVIYIDDPNIASIPVRFCVTSAGATTFQASACRGASGCSAGCVPGISINQDRNLDLANWPMP